MAHSEHKTVSRRERRGCLARGYEISDTLLGGGALGRVFLAEATKDVVSKNSRLQVIARRNSPQQSLQVAIKIIHVDSGALSLEKLAKYIPNEVCNMNTVVGSPNIIMLLDVFVYCKRVFLVTELAARGSIKSLCQAKLRVKVNNRSMSEAEARFFFRGIIHGLSSLHQQNIAHRDLKLDNILICESGQIKLADFGFSVQLPVFDPFNENMIEVARDQMKSTMCGIPAYMAPEVLRGRGGYDAIRADLWSLGVILFILTNGQLPYRGKTAQDVLKQIEKTGRDGLKFETDLSCECKDLIQKLMKYRPCERINTITAIHHPWMDDANPVKKPDFAEAEPIAWSAEETTKLKQDPVYETQEKFLRSYLLQRSQLLSSKLSELKKELSFSVLRGYGFPIALPRRENSAAAPSFEVWRLTSICNSATAVKDKESDGNLSSDPYGTSSTERNLTRYEQQSSSDGTCVHQVTATSSILDWWRKLRDKNNPPLTDIEKCLQLYNTVDLDVGKPWPPDNPIPKPSMEWIRLKKPPNPNPFFHLYRICEVDGIKMTLRPVTQPIPDFNVILVSYTSAAQRNKNLDEQFRQQHIKGNRLISPDIGNKEDNRTLHQIPLKQRSLIKRSVELQVKKVMKVQKLLLPELINNEEFEEKIMRDAENILKETVPEFTFHKTDKDVAATPKEKHIPKKTGQEIIRQRPKGKTPCPSGNVHFDRNTVEKIASYGGKQNAEYRYFSMFERGDYVAEKTFEHRSSSRKKVPRKAKSETASTFFNSANDGGITHSNPSYGDTESTKSLANVKRTSLLRSFKKKVSRMMPSQPKLKETRDQHLPKKESRAADNDNVVAGMQVQQIEKAVSQGISVKSDHKYISGDSSVRTTAVAFSRNELEENNPSIRPNKAVTSDKPSTISYKMEGELLQSPQNDALIQKQEKMSCKLGNLAGGNCSKSELVTGKREVYFNPSWAVNFRELEALDVEKANDVRLTSPRENKSFVSDLLLGNPSETGSFDGFASVDLPKPLTSTKDDTNVKEKRPQFLYKESTGDIPDDNSSQSVISASYVPPIPKRKSERIGNNKNETDGPMPCKILLQSLIVSQASETTAADDILPKQDFTEKNLKNGQGGVVDQKLVAEPSGMNTQMGGTLDDISNNGIKQAVTIHTCQPPPIPKRKSERYGDNKNAGGTSINPPVQPKVGKASGKTEDSFGVLPEKDAEQTTDKSELTYGSDVAQEIPRAFVIRSQAKDILSGVSADSTGQDVATASHCPPIPKRKSERSDNTTNAANSSVYDSMTIKPIIGQVVSEMTACSGVSHDKYSMEKKKAIELNVVEQKLTRSVSLNSQVKSVFGDNSADNTKLAVTPAGFEPPIPKRKNERNDIIKNAAGASDPYSLPVQPKVERTSGITENSGILLKKESTEKKTLQKYLEICNVVEQKLAKSTAGDPLEGQAHVEDSRNGSDLPSVHTPTSDNVRATTTETENVKKCSFDDISNDSNQATTSTASYISPIPEQKSTKNDNGIAASASASISDVMPMQTTGCQVSKAGENVGILSNKDSLEINLKNALEFCNGVERTLEKSSIELNFPSKSEAQAADSGSGSDIRSLHTPTSDEIRAMITEAENMKNGIFDDSSDDNGDEVMLPKVQKSPVSVEKSLKADQVNNKDGATDMQTPPTEIKNVSNEAKSAKTPQPTNESISWMTFLNQQINDVVNPDHGFFGEKPRGFTTEMLLNEPVNLMCSDEPDLMELSSLASNNGVFSNISPRKDAALPNPIEQCLGVKSNNNNSMDSSEKPASKIQTVNTKGCSGCTLPKQLGGEDMEDDIDFLEMRQALDKSKAEISSASTDKSFEAGLEPEQRAAFIGQEKSCDRLSVSASDVCGVSATVRNSSHIIGRNSSAIAESHTTGIAISQSTTSEENGFESSPSKTTGRKVTDRSSIKKKPRTTADLVEAIANAGSPEGHSKNVGSNSIESLVDLLNFRNDMKSYMNAFNKANNNAKLEEPENEEDLQVGHAKNQENDTINQIQRISLESPKHQDITDSDVHVLNPFILSFECSKTPGIVPKLDFSMSNNESKSSILSSDNQVHGIATAQETFQQSVGPPSHLLQEDKDFKPTERATAGYGKAAAKSEFTYKQGHDDYTLNDPSTAEDDNVKSTASEDDAKLFKKWIDKSKVEVSSAGADKSLEAGLESEQRAAFIGQEKSCNMLSVSASGVCEAGAAAATNCLPSTAMNTVGLTPGASAENHTFGAPVHLTILEENNIKMSPFETAGRKNINDTSAKKKPRTTAELVEAIANAGSSDRSTQGGRKNSTGNLLDLLNFRNEMKSYMNAFNRANNNATLKEPESEKDIEMGVAKNQKVNMVENVCLEDFSVKSPKHPDAIEDDKILASGSSMEHLKPPCFVPKLDFNSDDKSDNSSCISNRSAYYADCRANPHHITEENFQTQIYKPLQFAEYSKIMYKDIEKTQIQAQRDEDATAMQQGISNEMLLNGSINGRVNYEKIKPVEAVEENTATNLSAKKKPRTTSELVEAIANAGSSVKLQRCGKNSPGSLIDLLNFRNEMKSYMNAFKNANSNAKLKEPESENKENMKVEADEIQASDVIENMDLDFPLKSPDATEMDKIIPSGHSTEHPNPPDFTPNLGLLNSEDEYADSSLCISNRRTYYADCKASLQHITEENFQEQINKALPFTEYRKIMYKDNEKAQMQTKRDKDATTVQQGLTNDMLLNGSSIGSPNHEKKTVKVTEENTTTNLSAKKKPRTTSELVEAIATAGSSVKPFQHCDKNSPGSLLDLLNFQNEMKSYMNSFNKANSNAMLRDARSEKEEDVEIEAAKHHGSNVIEEFPQADIPLEEPKHRDIIKCDELHPFGFPLERPKYPDFIPKLDLSRCGNERESSSPCSGCTENRFVRTMNKNDHESDHEVLPLEEIEDLYESRKYDWFRTNGEIKEQNSLKNRKSKLLQKQQEIPFKVGNISKQMNSEPLDSGGNDVKASNSIPFPKDTMKDNLLKSTPSKNVTEDDSEQNLQLANLSKPDYSFGDCALVSVCKLVSSNAEASAQNVEKHLSQQPADETLSRKQKRKASKFVKVREALFRNFSDSDSSSEMSINRAKTKPRRKRKHGRDFKKDSLMTIIDRPHDKQKYNLESCGSSSPVQSKRKPCFQNLTQYSKSDTESGKSMSKPTVSMPDTQHPKKNCQHNKIGLTITAKESANLLQTQVATHNDDKQMIESLIEFFLDQKKKWESVQWQNEELEGNNIMEKSSEQMKKLLNAAFTWAPKSVRSVQTQTDMYGAGKMQTDVLQKPLICLSSKEENQLASRMDSVHPPQEKKKSSLASLTTGSRKSQKKYKPLKLKTNSKVTVKGTDTSPSGGTSTELLQFAEIITKSLKAIATATENILKRLHRIESSLSVREAVVNRQKSSDATNKYGNCVTSVAETKPSCSYHSSSFHLDDSDSYENILSASVLHYDNILMEESTDNDEKDTVPSQRRQFFSRFGIPKLARFMRKAQGIRKYLRGKNGHKNGEEKKDDKISLSEEPFPSFQNKSTGGCNGKCPICMNKRH